MKTFLIARQSQLIALGIVVAVSAWLLTGNAEPGTGQAPAADGANERRLLTSVRVRALEPRRISREIVVSGRTEPARAVTLRSEINGRVIALGAQRGARVERGAVIAQLDLRDRKARLAEAEAVVVQRRLEFDGAAQLRRDSLQSEAQLAQARANLEAAKALVEHIKVEIDNATVRAPFGGILERRPVEVGAYVAAGDEIARLIEENPMLVTGSVSQQDRSRLVIGDRGIARLVTGQLAEGVLRYIASESDPATRTFRIELQVPNPGGTLVSGVTGEISIPVQMLTAYHLSPALLSLNPSDVLGIKVVDEQNVVRFLPVEVVRSTADGVWVTGVPPEARVITVGQGFVRAGERVRAVSEAQVAEQPGAGERQ